MAAPPGELTGRTGGEVVLGAARAAAELRFGLTDGRPHTLDEIGRIYGVTRERIRQIEARAIAKLRHPRDYRT